MRRCKAGPAATAALSPAGPSGLCLHLRKVSRSLLNIGGKVRDKNRIIVSLLGQMPVVEAKPTRCNEGSMITSNE
jgi:hypothetical protein